MLSKKGFSDLLSVVSAHSAETETVLEVVHFKKKVAAVLKPREYAQ
jgi:hypothetical protein